MINKLRRPSTTSLYWSVWANNCQLFRHPGVGNPLRVYRINPGDIEYIFTGSVSKFITEGDWDKDRRPVEEWFRYRMFKKRFRDNVQWQEIEEYQELEARIIEDGQIETLDIPTSEQSPEALLEYHQYIDELYESIKTNGYKTQTELDPGSHFDTKTGHPALNEVQVVVDRSGELMVKTGYHRFTIARLLGLDSIPVRTHARHTEWQTVRDKISTANKPNELSREAMAQLDHPELQDLVPEEWRES